MKRYAKQTALALAMALTVSSVAPATASAATKPSYKKKFNAVKKGKTLTYTVKNIKKGTKVKWSIIGTGKKYVSFNKSKAVYKENTKAAKKKTYSSNKVYVRKNTTKVVKAVVKATVTGKNGKKYTVSDKIAIAKKATTPATKTPASAEPTAAVTTAPATTAPATTAPASAEPTATAAVTTAPATTAPATTAPASVAPTATATAPETSAPVATTTPAVVPTATTVAPTETPTVVTGGAITVTGVVTGASVKVVSGTTIVAETIATSTTATIANIANGTYTVVVSANGCNDATKLVTVNGDVVVDFVLSAKTLDVVGVSAEDTQGNVLSLDKVTRNGVVKVAFNSAVDKETVNSSTFKITDETGTPIGIPSTDIKLDVSGKTVSVSFENTSLEKKKSYTLTVANVKSTDGLTAKESKTTFTVADMAVVNSIKSYITTGSAVEADLIESKNAQSGVDKIVIAYNEAIDTSTAVVSNISILDVSKNEKKAIKTITTDTTGKKIILTIDGALTDDKQYTLSLSNIKTSLGSVAEDYKLTFAVNGKKPVVNNDATVTTLDNINLTVDDAWPLLTAGTHETNETSTYYAGFQLKIQFKQKLDKDSAEKYIKLVDAKADAYVDATVVYDEASKMATITPAKDLNEGAAYRVVVLGGLKTVQGIYMDYDKQNDEKATLQSFETLEITSPTIVNVESTDGLTDLKPNEDHIFTVTFSKPVSQLNNSSYNAKVLLVKSNTSVEDYRSVSNDYSSIVDIAAVPGTDNKSYTIKIKGATTPLEYDGAYKLIIVGEDLCEDTGIAKNAVNCDTSNNTLKTSTNVVFTTAALDKTGPTVSKVYSGDKIDAAQEITSTKTNVVSGSSMVFEFNEELKADATLGANTTIILEQYNGVTGAWKNVDNGIGIAEAAYVKNSAEKDVAVKVTFGDGLNADGKYRVVFKENSVYDNANNGTATPYNGLEKEYKFEFIGSNDKDTNVDIVAGTINDNVIVPQTSGNLSTKAKFVVAFEETDITNVKAENIVVQDADGKVVAGKVAEKAITATGSEYTKMYVFTPDEELKNSTVYTITVDGVKDVAGNAIAKKVVQLKTAGADVKVDSISIDDKATSVDLQKTITIKLTDAVDFVNGETAEEGKKNVSVVLTGAEAENGTVALASDGKSVTIKFTSDKKLAANTDYKLVVKTQTAENGAWKDVADSEKTVNFTTGVKATDDVAPTIKVATLGAITLEANKKVTGDVEDGQLILTFDEGVNKDDLNVVITNMSDSTKAVDVLSSELTKAVADNDTLKVNTVGMSNKCTYKIVVSGIKDAAGNVVDSVTYYVEGNFVNIQQ